MEISRENRTQQFEEDRYKQYLAERKQQQAAEIDSLDAEHKNRIENLTKAYGKEENDLEDAYKVELKHKVEMNDAKLAQVQKEYEQALKSEKESHDKEFEKMRVRERTRIES